jgi:trans-2,3-dihydro-3-hydroxyanthranilate isomerase
MDQIEVIHTRVFAADARGGNPCPVILDADSLDDNEMLTVARRFGLDTVFILKPKAETADVRLRFFVPDHEMGISGHATIAAITVALIERQLRPRQHKVETSSGLFAFVYAQNDYGYVVTLEQNPPVFGSSITSDRVASALRICADGIASNESPLQTVSVSRPKLIVPLKERQILNHLKPDFEALWQLCDAEKVSGLYPFTRHACADGADAEARQFPLRAGFYEDAALGWQRLLWVPILRSTTSKAAQAITSSESRRAMRWEPQASLRQSRNAKPGRLRGRPFEALPRFSGLSRSTLRELRFRNF